MRGFNLNIHVFFIFIFLILTNKIWAQAIYHEKTISQSVESLGYTSIVSDELKRLFIDWELNQLVSMPSSYQKLDAIA